MEICCCGEGRTEQLGMERSQDVEIRAFGAIHFFLSLSLCLSLFAFLDGIIVSNTTIARPEMLQSVHKTESGGLSGRPL